MTSLIDELRWRGMLQDATDGSADHLAEAPRTVYIGFDPTARSLHVGNLQTVMGLVHAQRAGHRPIALVGGGTGLIGDPSFRAEERRLLTKEIAAEYAEAIRGQLERFLDFGSGSAAAVMRNNLDWLGGLSLVDFLRDVGKHFSVNQLIAKEAVKRRLQESESGLSFTEFSYALLQSYDFLELHRRDGCTVQMGGSDQWGNITAGIDLVRRVAGERAYGVVLPLLTDASGSKFGKSEGASVWLDPAMTTPYQFYQFWLNVDDADVIGHLMRFTLVGRDRIDELAAATRERAHAREAQRALAEDVTRRVHGEDALSAATRASEALFGGALAGLSADEIADVFADVPSSEVSRDELSGAGKPVIDLLAESGVASSKGDARRSLDGGGIYLNNVRVTDVERSVTANDAIEGRFLVLRKGKKSYHLVAVTG